LGRTGGFSLNFSLLKKTAVEDPMIEISSVKAFVSQFCGDIFVLLRPNIVKNVNGERTNKCGQ
jgi:hypothetical protein